MLNYHILIILYRFLLFIRNEEISKLQSNICGQLGSIAIALNQMYYVLLNNPYEDKLIDDYLSTIDAASMIKPYMRAEEDSMKKTLKTVYKVNLNTTLV